MPPRRRTAATSGPTRVEAIQHGDKRSNIPTADAAEDYGFVPDPKQLRYDRDPALDPQLVWRGKDQQDASDLLVDAPPIYIQEKINPLVLVENLRRTARSDEPEPELSLFDTFDGLDELDAVDFYRHQANWSNRMILGDSLQVMASLTERESLRGKVQMIYLDPPYGIKFGSNWQASARKRDVKDGKVEDAAREAEQIKAFRDTWELGIHSYLAYLRDRLIVARDLLTESGSIFVQIGDENVHLVRSLLDEVFGAENFVSLVSFVTTSGFSQSTALGRAGDYLVWYASDSSQVKARTIFRNADGRQSYRWIQLSNGGTRALTRLEREGLSPIPQGARLYAPDNIQSQGAASECQQFRFRGRFYSPASSSHWKASYPDGMNRLALADRIHVAKNSIRYIRFADDFGLQAFTNNWTDTATGNFTDDKLYVVQTSSKVIERCLLMCTDPGDLVLDPTCGSGTTAYVAEQWGRRWITIDTSRVALALARQRLMGARYPYYLIADSVAGRAREQELTGTPGPSDPARDDIRLGFVYERVQHITLKSIANNPDLVEGMTREQIDAAIRRHADFEVLYDKPYEDKAIVRVTGPFTVESLTPHRSLTFGNVDENAEREAISEYHAATDPEGPTFEQSVLDNLIKAGVQIGRRAERIEFASLDPHAGTYLNAIGIPVSAEDTPGSARRVGVVIGPQYGTVDPGYIKAAVREAIAVGDIDLLCVMAFSFDAQTAEVTEVDGVDVRPVSSSFAQVAEERTVGRLRLLKVRMNHDLLMGEELKKTGAGNLFTVFGEPDIDLRTCPGGYEVEIRGIDVYDPTTGDVRSGGTDKLALWMIDTNYNEEAFFVRHCYFTGGLDPYKKLKAALKADIDVNAWDSLTGTTSRPFLRPETGRIAVKVINDYGDEVMKVYSV